METLLMIDPYLLTTSVAGIINLVANILTMFIDDTKVSKFTKPLVGVLNLLALNVFKNRNK